MAPIKKDVYFNLLQKYNIQFDGPVDAEDWPAFHKKTFENIRKLGRIDFQQYHESISADFELHPWREQTKRRAERVSKLAMRCLKGRRNEAGWRLLLESEILVRFTVEVAWLWRSEIEAALSNEDEAAESLVERRKGRAPCSCRSTQWKGDPQEQGVGLLFDDRAQEECVHSEAVMADLPKRSEQPDRIYGLRMGRRLERLMLWSQDNRPSSCGKMIAEALKTSPFRPDGEPVLFPFLVLEAKSEKGRESFSDIEVQTAFSIRTLLELQQGLYDAAAEKSISEARPFVWFLSYKGEQWRVSAGFVRDERGSRTYVCNAAVQTYSFANVSKRIVDLWDGRINSKEGALRLLLIIDYIFDWARDIYRESVISQLRSLSTSDTQSLGIDSDVLSMLDPFQHFAPNTDEDIDRDVERPSSEDQKVIEDVLRRFDSPKGAMRYARYIQSRFMCLYLTEDNFSLFVRSLKTPQHARTAARTILRFLKNCWRVHAEALDDLERTWTGKNRESENLYSPTKEFLVMVTLTAYIAPSWEQTRELTLLAVSTNVIDALVREADQSTDDDWNLLGFPYVEENVVVGNFAPFRNAPMRETLIAATLRTCVSSRLFAEESNKKKNGPSPGIWATSIEKQKSGIRYRFDAALMPDDHAHAREFVVSIYNMHKIGRSEPSSSFLRLSDCLDEQKDTDESSPGLWSIALNEVLAHRKFFTVTSKNPSNVSEFPELCLFVIDNASIEDMVESQQAFELIDEWSLQARRADLKPGWGRGWNNVGIRVRDRGLPEKIPELLGHVESAMNSRLLSAKSNGKGKSPERSWKPKSKLQHWNMSSVERQGLADILKFKDHLNSRGKRLAALTLNYPGWNNDENPSKVNDATVCARVVGPSQPIDDSFVLREEPMDDLAIGDGEPGPSHIPQQLKRAYEQMNLESANGESAEAASPEPRRR
ncbi:MAG: hypothetical protein M1822_007792 [Bathelium mastoideum]|nr:MAG: hypothetical protein M1822_007792 [Bathelium mastoideum]